MKLLSIDRAMDHGLASRDLGRMRRLARVAARHGRRVWLVGGPLRDLLLGREVVDLDLAIDGDVHRVGAEAARQLDGEFRRHPRFSTGTILLPEGGHLDLAATRVETYDAPAALPQVEPGGIEQDLARRDFTINAMALEIRARSHGALLDPFGGRADLRKGVLRVLHADSFRDDPTRLFRAARFLTRFALALDARTRRWIGRAVRDGQPARLSGERVAAELRHLFREPDPSAALGRLAAWSVGAAWAAPGTPTAAGRSRVRQAFNRLATWRDLASDRAALGLACAFHDRPLSRRRSIAERLRLRRNERRLLIEGVPAASRLIGRLKRSTRASAIDRGCSALDPSILGLAAALAPAPVYRKIGDWWNGARLLELGIDGHDLRRAGLPPGPAHARALAAARRAVIEGRVATPGEQLAVALRAGRRT